MYLNKLIDSPFVINKLAGSENDGINNPRDLDFHTDQNRNNELWVINENSATFDPNFGGSTVTYYYAGSENQWADYRKDSYSGHFMNTASAIAFSNNGGFANTLDVQDANGNQNGYFSGCTLWDSDTSIYARVNQNGPELGSHWDMLHQSPYSVGIASETDNIYWLFDGYHNTIAKYNFQELNLPITLSLSFLDMINFLNLENGNLIMKGYEFLKTFNTIEHRFEDISFNDEVTYINDSKATNFHAVSSAISRVKNAILILHGLTKGMPASELELNKNIRFDVHSTD